MKFTEKDRYRVRKLLKGRSGSWVIRYYTDSFHLGTLRVIADHSNEEKQE